MGNPLDGKGLTTSKIVPINNFKNYVPIKALQKSAPPDWLENLPISDVAKLTLACSFEDLVMPIMHCALAIIGGHFLDVEKSEN